MALEIQHLTKKYGKKLAVNHVSMVLENGVHALIGPNGSGKTTLMRMICDILRPDSGNIYYDGKSIKELNESYREILGYLPQHFGYYPNFTAWNFMLYLTSLKGLPEVSAKKRCKELLELVGLEEEMHRKIKTYSGGMKQRLGIAQALINDPKVLVLDEPTAGLDPKERIRFRNIIQQLSKDRIILLCTHIVSDVEYIADSLLVMKNGELILSSDLDSSLKCLEGKVFEGIIEEYSDQYQEQMISQIKKVNNGIFVHMISEEKPFKGAKNVQATLEDLYLYYFGEVDSYETNSL